MAVIVRIKNPDKTASKQVRIAVLARYIRNPETTNGHEKCVYSIALNFLSDNPETQIQEMVGLSEQSVRSKDTIEHYVWSLKEGEQPSKKQIDEAADILLSELGLIGHQLIAGYHIDTDDDHVHFEINRVHPVTGELKQIDNGFWKEACQRACARIEHAQGWRREENFRYVILDDGRCVRSPSSTEDHHEPGQRQRQMETMTGERSAMRDAIEIAGPILMHATHWQQVHQALAANGMRYKTVGSGAVILVGETPIKASTAWHAGSFSKMEKRLGIFQPPKTGMENNNGYFKHPPSEQDAISARSGVDPYDGLHKLSECRLAYTTGKKRTAGVLSTNARPRGSRTEQLRRERDPVIQSSKPKKYESKPLRPNSSELDAYRKARTDHNQAKKFATAEQRAAHATERDALRAEHRSARDAVFSGNWKGHGANKNQLASHVAKTQADRRAEIKERQARERAELRQRYRPFPSYEKWLREHGCIELADEWRMKFRVPGQISGDTNVLPKPRDIRSFVASAGHRQVQYTRAEDFELGPAFADLGRRIDVYAWRERDALLAALQLSASKWSSLTLSGTDEYKAMCIRVAVEHGFRISNPELQEAIEIERERVKVERAEARKSPELKAWEAYNNCIAAERYQVTTVKTYQSGFTQTFLLGKRDGILNGFSAAQMPQRVSEMNRHAEKGEAIEIRPISELVHYICIDNVTSKKLDRIAKDGYKPCMILRAGEDKHQVVLTISRLGLPDDDDVARNVSLFLNRSYGSKNSGYVCCHAAPGFGEATVLKAVQRDCEKTMDLSRNFAGKFMQKEKVDLQEEARADDWQEEAAEAAYDILIRKKPEAAYAIAAYQRHLPSVKKIVGRDLRKTGEKLNLSKVDSMIALRMRMTGNHRRAAIKKAIQICGPTIREAGDNVRSWEQYAESTVAFAFGPEADRQIPGLEKYLESWHVLEGHRPESYGDFDDVGKQEDLEKYLADFNLDEGLINSLEEQDEEGER